MSYSCVDLQLLRAAKDSAYQMPIMLPLQEAATASQPFKGQP